MNATIEGAREALNHSLDTLEDGELRADRIGWGWTA